MGRETEMLTWMDEKVDQQFKIRGTYSGKPSIEKRATRYSMLVIQDIVGLNKSQQYKMQRLFDAVIRKDAIKKKRGERNESTG